MKINAIVLLMFIDLLFAPFLFEGLFSFCLFFFLFLFLLPFNSNQINAKKKKNHLWCWCLRNETRYNPKSYQIHSFFFCSLVFGIAFLFGIVDEFFSGFSFVRLINFQEQNDFGDSIFLNSHFRFLYDYGHTDATCGLKTVDRSIQQQQKMIMKIYW